MTKDSAKSLRERSQELETQTREAAHKIWLAGLGAYGRAFSEAIEGAQKLNEGTSELFDDLVKRGTDIENEMKDRITSNDRVKQATESVGKVSESVGKVTDTAVRLQREQRERFEARMQRMRALLGFGGDEKADEISEKLDRLEDEIASLSAKTGKSGPDKAVSTRLARLSAEINAIAEVNAPKGKKAPAKRKTAAKKATTATKATAKRKAPAKRKTAKA
ncbi:MAG: phasin family protein [Pseudomonadota bacterium]